MSDERRYLKELSQKLDEYAFRVQALPGGGDYEKLRQLLQEILSVEADLRGACEIGMRFNVIRTQLQVLLEKFEKEVAVIQGTAQDVDVEKEKELAADEIFVYVYLFNAQGALLKTWQKLLLTDALVEHSVNRPVYADKKEVLKMLSGKPNRVQHGCLEIAVKNHDIVQAEGEPLKDQHGFVLLKLKQGALKVKNIYSFFYNGQQYRLEDDELVLDEQVLQ